MAELARYELAQRRVKFCDYDIEEPFAKFSHVEDIVQRAPVVNPTITIEHFEYLNEDRLLELQSGNHSECQSRMNIPTSFAIYWNRVISQVVVLSLSTLAAELLRTASKVGSYQELLNLCMDNAESSQACRELA